MKSVITASIVLVTVVMAVSLLLYVTGLHSQPMVGGVGSLLVVIGANITVVFWALKQTAGENGYMRQLGNGALVGIVGGTLVFVASMVLLATIPNYLSEMQAAQISALEQWELPEDALAEQIAKIEAITPAVSSMQGTIGTFFTSLITGAIVAIFQRRKA